MTVARHYGSRSPGAARSGSTEEQLIRELSTAVWQAEQGLAVYFRIRGPSGTTSPELDAAAANLCEQHTRALLKLEQLRGASALH